ncbi:T9SS type A sorting domain-containing protein [Aquimarina pacifica]|uniref:T9SS type A sorting domain-containing protein n=1 Tax=Aquimarina pacifica TaxID=1296415 RepID=UPI0009DD7FA2
MLFNNNSETPECIDENEQISNKFDFEKIRVYPIPTKGELGISGLESVNYSIEIIDMQGKKVFMKSLSADVSSINVESLEVGAYMLIINRGSIKKTVLFTKI